MVPLDEIQSEADVREEQTEFRGWREHALEVLREGKADGFYGGVFTPRKDEVSGNDMGSLDDSGDTPRRISEVAMRLKLTDKWGCSVAEARIAAIHL